MSAKLQPPRPAIKVKLVCKPADPERRRRLVLLLLKLLDKRRTPGKDGRP